MCQPGWEGFWGESGYMSIYGWVSSMFTWNKHNIVNRLSVSVGRSVNREKVSSSVNSENVSLSVVSDSLCPHGLYPDRSSTCGILQARILEWVAIPFSRGSSWSRVWTRVSWIGGRFFTIWATREANFAVIRQIKRCMLWQAKKWPPKDIRFLFPRICEHYLKWQKMWQSLRF